MWLHNSDFSGGSSYRAASVENQVGEITHSIIVNGIADGHSSQGSLKLTHLRMRGYWEQIGVPNS